MKALCWKRILLVKLLLAAMLLSLVLVTMLRWVPVKITPVMLKRAFQERGRETVTPRQEWVSLEEISPELIDAVLLSEDQLFRSHHGFDWKAIEMTLRSHFEEGIPLRGCSTISQQTAKNVFTLASRSWARKAAESWWTVLIELFWGKDRILEVYLNVAEWGPGIFGIQSAAKEYYGIPASGLDTAQAASLAVCLPNPLQERPDRLSPHGRQLRSRLIRLIESGSH